MQIGEEVGKRVAAGIVVVSIAADKSSHSEDGVGADQADPRRGNVERLDLSMLIGRANRVAVGVKAVVGDHQAFPGGGILRVKRIGILKPGTRVSQIQVDGIAGRDLVVDPVEQVFLVSLGVYHGELGWIQETTAIERVGRNEIAPLVAAVGEVDADIGGPERTVRSGHSSGWLLYPLAGAGREVNDQAGFLTILGGWGSRDDFNGLHRI